MSNSIQSLIIDQTILDAPHDPGISQRNASTPSRHVWVRASAGSGKTKVLIDRLLRLLLPDPLTKAPGTPPDKILCLTFTKAGAAEMSLRLQKRLLEWSVKKTDELKEELDLLTGTKVSDDFVRDAKQLLAKILDAPSRMKILTIHSFCQSVLGRFPIETGLSPDFKVAEESEASEFLQKALIDNLVYAAEHPETDIGQVFARLAVSKNLEQLQSDLRKIIQEPLKLQNFLVACDTLGDIQTKISISFGIENAALFTDVHFCDENSLPRHSLQIIADKMAQSSAMDIKSADMLYTFLSADITERLRTLSSYKKVIQAKPRGKVAYDDPDLMERLVNERGRIERYDLAKNIMATADLLYLGRNILKSYEQHKKLLGVLDYNDLIFNTKRLLSGDFWGEDRDAAQKKMSTAWVLYKLDEGIDHILVDESQDTNPDQWDIVVSLTEEYFSGAAREILRPRTLFVVGDEKQSIFSFQRADPESFFRMREYFAEKAALMQEGFEESLVFSFRTTAPVLKVTDSVFEDPELGQHIGLQGSLLRHISFRSDKDKDVSGAVELWPLVYGEKKDIAQTSGWQLPFAGADSLKSAAELLAKRIASRLDHMIMKGEARAGDVMILMRTRSPLMLHIIRELKRRSLPVSGLDRMVLGESLIVQDILAFCDYCLLPENDLVLSCLLKSPFIGFTDDDLMKLCLGKETKLSVIAHLRANPEYAHITSWLDRISSYAGQVQPYEFLEQLLTLPCPADQDGSGYRACQARLGADALEPLDELLSQTLKLELQDIRTLQDFVAYQKSAHREIKREMEEGANQIRIMTVHASKGLEAPIVILPDTMTVPSRGKLDPFLWPDKSNLPAPLWAESSDTRSEIYQNALDRQFERQIAEHSRLLYVAMTRAKDRLIVCGAAKSEKIDSKSWYAAVTAGFDRLDNIIETDSGERIYSLSDEKPKIEVTKAKRKIELPSWLRQKAPEEKESLKSFSPSRQDIDDQPVYSPLGQSQEHRFRRGIATHKLLQILPDIHPDRQEEAARQYLLRAQLGFSNDLQESIAKETMRILRDPVFAPVFGHGSLAEVPVTGQLRDGRLINGQIDRLIITDHEILIVDFKTNRPSPADTSLIPQSYRNQLKAYADALSSIYPDHAIKCALLWTDRPLLMPVSI